MVLWASEETLIISFEVRNAGKAVNRSIVRLWQSGYKQTRKWRQVQVITLSFFFCTYTGALLTGGYKSDTFLTK